MPGGVSYGLVPLSTRMLKDARRCELWIVPLSSRMLKDARRCDLWIRSLELKDA